MFSQPLPISNHVLCVVLWNPLNEKWKEIYILLLCSWDSSWADKQSGDRWIRPPPDKSIDFVSIFNFLPLGGFQ